MNKRFQKYIIKTIPLIFLILLTGYHKNSAQVLPGQAPDFLWAESGGGDGNDGATDLTVDKDGNIIVTGYFESTATFGSFNLLSAGSSDIYIAKYSPDGNVIWAVRAGGDAYEAPHSVITDNLGNIFITGEFSFGTSVFGTVTLNPFGGSDIFTAKYTSNGIFLWVQQGGGQSSDIGYEVTTDKLNNILVTGFFEDFASFGDSTITGTGQFNNIFVVKYNSFGIVQWVRAAGEQSDFALSYGIRTDNNNNVFITGSFSGLAVFGDTTLVSSWDGTNADIFLAKYNSQGNFIWVAQAGGINSNSDSNGEDIRIDKDNNILLTGAFTGDALFGNILLSGLENTDIFIAKYDQSGDALWAIQDHGSSLDNEGREIDLDAAGNISLIASIYSTGDEIGDIYFARYTNTGIKLWGIVAGLNGLNEVGGLAIDSNGDIYGSGNFYFSGTYGTITLNGVSGEAFVAKLPSPKFSINPNPEDFGLIPIGSVDSATVTLTNTSGANLHIFDISIVNDTSEAFGIFSGLPLDSIIAMQSVNLGISFMPIYPNYKDAFFEIISDASTSPDTIFVSGTGSSSITVELPSNPNIGQSTFLSITPPASTLFSTSEIYYRKTGEMIYQQDNLSFQENVYTFNIPPEYSAITGIQYYVLFSDGSNIITYPTLNPDTNPASIQVNIPQIDFQNPIKNSQYQMLSIPLSINSPQIDSVFSDDYGPYSNNVWRIFRWQPEINNYAEYNAISGNIIPGNAFWLINRDGKTFDIDNALSVQSSNNYTITLQPGYNQIGIPFAFPVDWLSIENSDLILQAPIHWNADTQENEMDQLTLIPWEGYWVYNPLNEVVNLNVNPNLPLGKKQSVNIFASLKDDEFLLQVKAIMNSSRAKDQQNFVGMMENAKNGLDKYDVIKPPAINDQVRVLIESGNNYFARNVVPVSKDGAYWDFTVETKSPNQQTTLIVESKSSLPDNFSIWLVDKNRKIPVEINNGSAEIITQENGRSNLRIIVGTEEFAKINSYNISLTPFEYALYQNYPNPFNPSTNILYQLKEKSNVTLEIYDILGRRIKSIINNVVQDPGQHIVTWNGLNSSGEKVASGIYVYRIRANNFITSKKMILMK